MMKKSVFACVCLVFSGCAILPSVGSREIHVAVNGSDSGTGAKSSPLKTIQAAANIAKPGDTVTVHAGIYREMVVPPAGGESDSKRIVFRAAPGEKVTITGSEKAQGWVKVENDTWKLTLPNSYFKKFNPFAEKVFGDWFDPRGRVHHRGAVYLNGMWHLEAATLGEVMKPAGNRPCWFAHVDGVVEPRSEYLLNVLSFQPQGAASVVASSSAKRKGTQNAPCSKGGECVGFIRNSDWLAYEGVDFGAGTENVEFTVAAIQGAGGIIEIRMDKADGEILGKCKVPVTGDWQNWQPLTAKIKKTDGKRNICLVVVSEEDEAKPKTDNTVIHAQFPGVDPNSYDVEISVRPAVFKPEKTSINYLTVRGFDLRNASPNWAAPTSGQEGLVTVYWCKGWIIENNEISYSRCCGIALAKYSDEWDNRRGSTEGYYGTIEDAIKKAGWSRDKIGGHVVRNNNIHHCEQTGIVGSLGCAFSIIENNEIHDIHTQGFWEGAEMAGIKFHGAIDVLIRNNHIYRCGSFGGIWLDWMAQGTQVTGNLLHDNVGYSGDLFCEVDHGPFLVANNIFLSGDTHLSNSRGGAYVHNLVAGSMRACADGRQTPYFKPHSTDMVGMNGCPLGDARFYNNVFGGHANMAVYDGATVPVTAAGNVYTKGANPAKFDKELLHRSEFDTGIKLIQKPDGWYLEINLDGDWAKQQKRQLVTTGMLGKAVVPNQAFDNPDGSALEINTDYFGVKRDKSNPFPGPFENVKNGKQTVKVWPVSRR